jgi:hypothetical protein
MGRGLVIAAVVLASVACGQGDDEAATSSSTSSSSGPPSSSASTAPPSTAPPAPESTAPAPAAEPTLAFPDPRAAVDHLVGAWQAGDSATALQGATAEAVTTLFRQPPDGFDLYGCDSGEFETSTCNYRNRSTGGYAQITAEKRPAGWVVAAVFVSTDG